MGDGRVDPTSLIVPILTSLVSERRGNPDSFGAASAKPDPPRGVSMSHPSFGVNMKIGGHSLPHRVTSLPTVGYGIHSLTLPCDGQLRAGTCSPVTMANLLFGHGPTDILKIRDNSINSQCLPTRHICPGREGTGLPCAMHPVCMHAQVTD